MKITVNGAERELPSAPLTVSGLIRHLALGPQPVLVERNGTAVLQREFDEEPIEDGDTIEIVRMVAGG